MTKHLQEEPVRIGSEIAGKLTTLDDREYTLELLRC